MAYADDDEALQDGDVRYHVFSQVLPVMFSIMYRRLIFSFDSTPSFSSILQMFVRMLASFKSHLQRCLSNLCQVSCASCRRMRMHLTESRYRVFLDFVGHNFHLCSDQVIGWLEDVLAHDVGSLSYYTRCLQSTTC
jgi:hypothetical protein